MEDKKILEGRLNRFVHLAGLEARIGASRVRVGVPSLHRPRVLVPAGCASARSSHRSGLCGRLCSALESLMSAANGEACALETCRISQVTS